MPYKPLRVTCCCKNKTSYHDSNTKMYYECSEIDSDLTDNVGLIWSTCSS